MNTDNMAVSGRPSISVPAPSSTPTIRGSGVQLDRPARAICLRQSAFRRRMESRPPRRRRCCCPSSTRSRSARLNSPASVTAFSARFADALAGPARCCPVDPRRRRCGIAKSCSAHAAQADFTVTFRAPARRGECRGVLGCALFVNADDYDQWGRWRARLARESRARCTRSRHAPGESAYSTQSPDRGQRRG